MKARKIFGVLATGAALCVAYLVLNGRFLLEDRILLLLDDQEATFKVRLHDKLRSATAPFRLSEVATFAWDLACVRGPYELDIQEKSLRTEAISQEFKKVPIGADDSAFDWAFQIGDEIRIFRFGPRVKTPDQHLDSLVFPKELRAEYPPSACATREKAFLVSSAIVFPRGSPTAYLSEAKR